MWYPKAPVVKSVGEGWRMSFMNTPGSENAVRSRDGNFSKLLYVKAAIYLAVTLLY
jgi:hypothetical protein